MCNTAAYQLPDNVITLKLPDDPVPEDDELHMVHSDGMSFFAHFNWQVKWQPGWPITWKAKWSLGEFYRIAGLPESAMTWHSEWRLQDSWTAEQAIFRMS